MAARWSAGQPVYNKVWNGRPLSATWTEQGQHTTLRFKHIHCEGRMLVQLVNVVLKLYLIA